MGRLERFVITVILAAAVLGLAAVMAPDGFGQMPPGPSLENGEEAAADAVELFVDIRHSEYIVVTAYLVRQPDGGGEVPVNVTNNPVLTMTPGTYRLEIYAGPRIAWGVSAAIFNLQIAAGVRP